MTETHVCKKCGIHVPEGVKLCKICSGLKTMNRISFSEGFVSNVGGFLVAIGSLFVVGYIYMFFFSPNNTEDKEQLSSEVSELMELTVMVEFSTNRVKLELMEASSLNIYLPLGDFHNVVYPEREAAVARVGNTWCSEVERNMIYFPVVTMKDIRTGKTLASYSCVMKSADLASD